MKLERFYDMFCPDYEPNWDNGAELKYYIYYYQNGNTCCVNSTIYNRQGMNVYFPTKEITQQICDILNNEKEDN